MSGSPILVLGDKSMSVPNSRDAGFSVLIVEDNESLATSLAMYLRISTGYQVEIALDGQTGIEAALRNRPDVVICDITLPNKDGFEVAEELRQSLPQKPLLLAVTGDPELADRLFQAGYDNYYVKPANPVEIETVIRLHEYNQRALRL